MPGAMVTPQGDKNGKERSVAKDARAEGLTGPGPPSISEPWTDPGMAYFAG